MSTSTLFEDKLQAFALLIIDNEYPSDRQFIETLLGPSLKRLDEYREFEDNVDVSSITHDWGEGIQTTLECLSLVVGLVLGSRQIYSWLKPSPKHLLFSVTSDQLHRVKKVLQKELTKAGMSKERAAIIVEKYTTEIVTMAIETKIHSTPNGIA